MAEIWFYHLERQTLDQVLPNLLERTLERGWRAVVQAGSKARLEAIDNLLWTYNDQSFLPHGMKRDGDPALQPVYLTEDDSNPNASDVRFLIEGAEMVEAEGYQRIVYLFDGADEAARAQARTAWAQVKASTHETTYWRQSEAGRWEKQQ
ncbi:MAG: DNA polymerase-3 subunit chi [Hyphomicrobiaceae bacterium]|jgi:DNA polymerase-3 subunit chi